MELIDFSIGEKLELRTNVSTIDKISLLARQHYCSPHLRMAKLDEKP